MACLAVRIRNVALRWGSSAMTMRSGAVDATASNGSSQRLPGSAYQHPGLISPRPRQISQRSSGLLASVLGDQVGTAPGPLLARNGHAEVVALCPFLGAGHPAASPRRPSLTLLRWRAPCIWTIGTVAIFGRARDSEIGVFPKLGDAIQPDCSARPLSSAVVPRPLASSAVSMCHSSASGKPLGWRTLRTA
jgi:hypothetical protein